MSIDTLSQPSDAERWFCSCLIWRSASSSTVVWGWRGSLRSEWTVESGVILWVLEIRGK